MYLDDALTHLYAHFTYWAEGDVIFRAEGTRSVFRITIDHTDIYWMVANQYALKYEYSYKGVSFRSLDNFTRHMQWVFEQMASNKIKGTNVVLRGSSIFKTRFPGVSRTAYQYMFAPHSTFDKHGEPEFWDTNILEGPVVKAEETSSGLELLTKSMVKG